MVVGQYMLHLGVLGAILMVGANKLGGMIFQYKKLDFTIFVIFVILEILYFFL